MKVLFIIDSIDDLRIQEGTTLELARSAIDLKHDVWFGESDDLQWINGEPSGEFFQLSQMSTHPLTQSKSRKQFGVLEQYDFVFLRHKQSSPSYFDTLRICSLADVEFDNSPTGILVYNHKISPLRYPDITPFSLVSNTTSSIRSFLDDHPDRTWIVKPTDGFRGKNIHKIQSDISKSDLSDILTRHHGYSVIQEYLPVNEKGDKRVIVVGGEPVAWGTRFPGDHDFIANHHAGGYYASSILTENEKSNINFIAEDLSRLDLKFAGVDMIDEKVIEVNVGSIGGVASLEPFFDFDVSKRILKTLLNKKINQTGPDYKLDR